MSYKGLHHRNRINKGPTHRKRSLNRHQLGADTADRFSAFTEAEEREPFYRQTWLDATDLAVYVSSLQHWWQRLLVGSPAQRFVEQSDRSVLRLPRPRWPRRHILLILRANADDWKTLPWLERLASALCF